MWLIRGRVPSEGMRWSWGRGRGWAGRGGAWEDESRGVRARALLFWTYAYACACVLFSHLVSCSSWCLVIITLPLITLHHVTSCHLIVLSHLCTAIIMIWTINVCQYFIRIIAYRTIVYMQTVLSSSLVWCLSLINIFYLLYLSFTFTSRLYIEILIVFQWWVVIASEL
jgi:hypothetical protein